MEPMRLVGASRRRSGRFLGGTRSTCGWGFSALAPVPPSQRGLDCSILARDHPRARVDDMRDVVAVEILAIQFSEAGGSSICCVRVPTKVRPRQADSGRIRELTPSQVRAFSLHRLRSSGRREDDRCVHDEGRCADESGR